MSDTLVAKWVQKARGRWHLVDRAPWGREGFIETACGLCMSWEGELSTPPPIAVMCAKCWSKWATKNEARA